ncbi:MAG: hypothetical protein Kow0062_28450 [Acidobacteriota bacterium]|nr:MAG: TetR/AcrR family transcriptional regulator [Acidobacteriota bacterium]
MAKLTRERILDVARSHFARDGYRRASLVEIARELGVVKGALYYHVPGGKLALFNAVMEREEQRMLAAMRRAARRARDPREALRAVFDARLEVLRDLKDLHGVRREIGEEISALTLAQERSFRRRERDLIAEILEDGERRGVFAPRGPRRAVAAAIQAMIHALTVPELFGRDDTAPGRARDRSGLRDAFFDLVLYGLETREPDAAAQDAG